MVAFQNLLAFIGSMGMPEMIILGVVAVLLFGSRLPSVARSLGKSIVEFKKGMNDISSEVKSSVYSEPTARVGYTEHSEPKAPKFEPPKAEDAEQQRSRAVVE
ncbi:MAG: twin-arginine translocase TatA/TatE family subunit [Pirellulales bacterium]